MFPEKSVIENVIEKSWSAKKLSVSPQTRRQVSATEYILGIPGIRLFPIRWHRSCQCLSAVGSRYHSYSPYSYSHTVDRSLLHIWHVGLCPIISVEKRWTRFSSLM